MDSKYRHIPAIHRLLDLPSMQIAIRDFGHAPVMEACRAAVDGLRQRVAAADVAEDAIGVACDALEEEILGSLRVAAGAAYPAVINATGVLLHTNLGRAPLPRQLSPSLESYLALEYDVCEGRRGHRYV